MLHSKDTTIRLPDPITKGEISLEEALLHRRSIREYTRDSLTIKEISQLLWAAQGITHKGWARTAPSAGATYPLEIYIVVNRVTNMQPGIYHYVPNSHILELHKSGDYAGQLRKAALDQDMIEKSAINIIITAVFERTTNRYGKRGNRYVHMEVGHVGENIYLQAFTLNLGTVSIGAFNDQRVQSLLDIKESPLYIMPVGKISSRD